MRFLHDIFMVCFPCDYVYEVTLGIIRGHPMSNKVSSIK